MISMKLIGLSIVVLIAGIVIAAFFDFGNESVHPEELNFFAEDYYDARRRFRLEGGNAGAEMAILPLSIEGMDLSIDVAVFRGRSDAMMVHVSGTHGVEGFAGSGIQTRILSDMSKAKEVGQGRGEDGPTVVMVHGLNAYGFAKLRRVNENNVDLNRNHLSEEELRESRERDPNVFGYMDFYDIFNPTGDILQWSDFFWLKSTVYVLLHGLGKFRSALIAGNYHFPTSLGYGGNSIQQSHVLLKQFLQENFVLEEVKKVAVLDVHTGLGPSGYDSLVLDAANKDTEAVAAIEENGKFKDHITVLGKEDEESAGSTSQSTMTGYGGVQGITPTGIINIFPSSARRMVLTQEFGTVSSVLVFKALRAENAAYHHAPQQRMRFAEDLRDVFYLRESASWKRDLLRAGTRVFNQLYGWLDSHMTSF